ncbi:DNA translocase FtsK 4TM domain-containing protein [Verrucomicrobiaceae bacterium 5K15]|uniref:DNA translocase FtsK 4TM domain-containing protein n=1 Tax=Oceaniferula flava TaxID=2800421 RepID=A0AAE2VCM6_9BACT|nr:DNA translocase FtsK 4TM domain-containing protein [Oceaniferula flavus]MBK1855840.1 DNA translocase FtsK 4TM domain-containing protein [Oceaniferula flavus]MBM1137147.1 DNA translocase FtsK 4TM domain-containing protein [Oceaniferula flavus]
MASPKNKLKNQKKDRQPWPNEVLGILLCGGGILLLLSLVSYSPADLVHLPFIGGDATPEAGSVNWIGPVGAFLGYVFLITFGSAAYLLPLTMIWLGVAKLAFDARPSVRTWIGCGVFVLSAAALMGVQNLMLQNWADANGLIGAGGYAGYGLGTKCLEALLNKPGAILVLLCVYLVSLILLTGLHPVAFSKAAYSYVKNWIQQRKERQLAEAEKASARERRRLERDNRLASGPSPSTVASDPKPADPAPARKKPAAKKAKTKPEEIEEPADPQAQLPLKEVPKPQIIDSSLRRKPNADPNAKPFQKKREETVDLSTDEYENYELPGFDLLNIPEHEEPEKEADTDELVAIQKTIIDTLNAFGVEVTAGNITRGPTITRYEVYPSLGLRVSRITQLEADLARATKAESINILAPVPGSDTVGIEIANNEKVAVPLHELLSDPAFASAKKKIPLALGKDVYGNTVIGDLAAMPHLLVAGATGSGKSVCINSIISSILFKFSPNELRFIMVDPKVVEMQMYNSLPHLAVPVVTDPNKVIAALRWVVNEMERRYRMFAECGVRNFDSFNSRELPEKEEPEEPEEVEGAEPEAEEEYDPEHIDSIARALTDGELGPPAMDGSDDDDDEEEEIPDRIPYIVVIIDELADLMQTAPADMEMNIARIAQKARAAGIHLIVATQTPRADVVTGIIKANIPSRIAFQVSSKLDSRVILDVSGADKLVGKGDMLYLPPGSAKLERAQGAFISDEEVEDLVKFCSNQVEQVFEKTVQESIEKGGSGGDEANDVSDADEEIVQKCMEVIRQEKKASTSLLQRRLRLGYTRAARMMDILEERGIIGPGEGAKPREILINVGQDEP